MSLSLREEVKLNQTDNAWVPTAAKKATKVDVAKNKNEDELKTEVRNLRYKILFVFKNCNLITICSRMLIKMSDLY